MQIAQQYEWHLGVSSAGSSQTERERSEMKQENNIDYQLLGALIGSAWRESHPKATLKQGSEARRLIEKALDFRLMASIEGQMFHAMMQTMERRCAFCGIPDVRCDDRGVYCCLNCRGKVFSTLTFTATLLQMLARNLYHLGWSDPKC